MITTRVGFWAAASLAVVGVVYGLVVAVGISRAGLDLPIVDPVLAVMEALTLLSAPLLVLLMAAIHRYAVPEKRALTSAALAFSVAMATLTSAVHFTALTSARQTGSFILAWPSSLYAVELLAWDVFLGLTLVFAAGAFAGDPLNVFTRRVMTGTGVLCLLGTIGPIIGDMRVQRIGVLGYGVGLPISCILLARVFWRVEARQRA